jgi:hypothetical protein
MSIDQRIREGLRSTNDEIPTPDLSSALSVVTEGDRSSRRRKAVVTGFAAAAAVTAVIAGLAGLGDQDDDSRRPGDPTTQTPTETPGPSMVNGRIQTVDSYLADSPCQDWGAFRSAELDQPTGRVVLAWIDLCGTGREQGVRQLVVLAPSDRLADLTCGAQLACPAGDDWDASFGPGETDLSVSGGTQEVLVIDFDGEIRRTIDLSSHLGKTESILDLVWSPDRSQLAVVTSELTPRTADEPNGQLSNLWLVSRDGGDPRLIHTSAYTGPLEGGYHPLGYLWSVAWSPDGRRLGFIEEHARIGHYEESTSIEAVSLSLTDQGTVDEETTLYDYTARPFDYAAFLWSPDGTRVAVRIPDHVLELSAEDGSVLARRPFPCTMNDSGCAPLVWPARS